MHLSTWVNWLDIMFFGQQTETNSSTQGISASETYRPLITTPFTEEDISAQDKGNDFLKATCICGVNSIRTQGWMAIGACKCAWVEGRCLLLFLNASGGLGYTNSQSVEKSFDKRNKYLGLVSWSLLIFFTLEMIESYSSLYPDQELKCTKTEGHMPGQDDGTLQWFVAVVQSLSHVQLSETPWTVAHQASLSFTISQNLLKLMSMESVVPSNHLILCHPVLPMNIQGWFPLGLTGLTSLKSKGLFESLLQHHNSKPSILQPSLQSNFHIHTWLLEKTIALTIWIFVGKVMSLLFNMLSRFVIAFLPRSKCLLISWLQLCSDCYLTLYKIHPWSTTLRNG